MQVRFGTKAALRCAFAAVLALVAFSATPALAKQCVWNKAGFLLRVDWFSPGAYSVAYNPASDLNEYVFLTQPVQTDVIWAPGGRCINRGSTQYDAVLSMCGVDPNFTNNRIIEYPEEWTPDQRLNDCSIFAATTPSLALPRRLGLDVRPGNRSGRTDLGRRCVALVRPAQAPERMQRQCRQHHRAADQRGGGRLLAQHQPDPEGA